LLDEVLPGIHFCPEAKNTPTVGAFAFTAAKDSAYLEVMEAAGFESPGWAFANQMLWKKWATDLSIGVQI
jgi:hypothetical protein